VSGCWARARRRHEQQRQPLAQIARELLAQTGYANARSAEMALRRQFKRRGWPLHSRRQAGATREVVAAREPLTAEAERAFEETGGPAESNAASEDES
jgi:hypothetical protein